MNNFGDMARYYRLLLGFRQDDMTGALKYSGHRETYSCKENGTTQFSLDELMALAAVLGIPARAFCYPELCHSGKSGQRPHRLSKESDPQYVYDLSPAERQIIALHRLSGISKDSLHSTADRIP